MQNKSLQGHSPMLPKEILRSLQKVFGDPKNIKNVFKPFYKMDKGRSDSKSSVGLGLSIASDIIRSHGGNIKLEKSSFGGLGVKIFLPV